MSLSHNLFLAIEWLRLDHCAAGLAPVGVYVAIAPY